MLYSFQGIIELIQCTVCDGYFLIIAITCRYSLIVDCWAVMPELRPFFAELVIRLSSQLLAIADYMDFSSAPDVKN